MQAVPICEMDPGHFPECVFSPYICAVLKERLIFNNTESSDDTKLLVKC